MFGVGALRRRGQVDGAVSALARVLVLTAVATTMRRAGRATLVGKFVSR